MRVLDRVRSTKPTAAYFIYHERGALVRGSDPAKVHRFHTAVLAASVEKAEDTKSRGLFDCKIWAILHLGVRRVYDTAGAVISVH